MLNIDVSMYIEAISTSSHVRWERGWVQNFNYSLADMAAWKKLFVCHQECKFIW